MNRSLNPARLPMYAIAVLVLAACGGGGGGGSDQPDPSPSPRSTPAAMLALKSFQAGCADFLDYAAEGLTEEYLREFVCLFDGPCPIFLEAAIGAPSDNAGSAPPPAAPDRASTTNTQEAGVDEADIVKADSAGRLYILSGSTLTVLPAFPPEQLASRELVSLNLAAGDPGFFAEDLFLDESRQRLLVLGSSFDAEGGAVTSVIVDISNPAAPRELERLGVDGHPLQARRIGARVHRVSRFDVPRPDWFFTQNDPLQARREAYFSARNASRDAEAESIKAEVRVEIERRLQAAGAGALLPRTFRELPGQPRTEASLACSAISRPDVSTGLGLALIDSFNIDGTARASSGVINNAYTVYASPTNLYLAQSSAGWFFAPDQLEETAVYRLALSEIGAAAYRALGKVPGSVRDSYSFSEHEGHLRVATTESAFGPGRDRSSNGLHILDARGSGEMPLVGKVAGLAPGERIQGSRLLGDRGFIVTFRQVDPLFALDLSDPRNPRVTDELKIPGFSSYLTPLGEDYLLTVGRAGNDAGLTGAVAVQLFDVRDMSNVRQVAVLTPAAGDGSYSYSVAEHDPHAFAYFSDSASAPTPGTLSLPLIVSGDRQDTGFAGFLVVRVAPGTDAPLSESGRIDHDAFLADREFCGSRPGDFCADAYFAAEPRRAVYMQSGSDTFLYTVSAVGVLANSAREPAVNLGARRLPYDPPCCFIRPVDAAGGGPRPL